MLFKDSTLNVNGYGKWHKIFLAQRGIIALKLVSTFSTSMEINFDVPHTTCVEECLYQGPTSHEPLAKKFIVHGCKLRNIVGEAIQEDLKDLLKDSTSSWFDFNKFLLCGIEESPNSSEYLYELDNTMPYIGI